MNRMAALSARTAHLETAVNRAVKFGIHGPRWLPRFIRILPLCMLSLIVRLLLVGI